MSNYSYDLSQDPKSTIKNQTNQRWDTLSIISEQHSYNKQCFLKKEDKSLKGMCAHQSWHKMAHYTMLRPVTTTATHIQDMLRNKGHNISGAQCERIGGYSLMFIELIVPSYLLSFPDDLYYQVMEKSPKYLYSIVIFNTKQWAPIVQECTPLLDLSSLRVLFFLLLQVT